MKAIHGLMEVLHLTFKPFSFKALALAKLCMDDPNVAEKDTILAKAHLQLSATYLSMVCCIFQVPYVLSIQNVACLGQIC